MTATSSAQGAQSRIIGDFSQLTKAHTNWLGCNMLIF
jgi:hypothetical protein